jgi:hypothetical protein
MRECKNGCKSGKAARAAARAVCMAQYDNESLKINPLPPLSRRRTHGIIAPYPQLYQDLRSFCRVGRQHRSRKVPPEADMLLVLLDQQKHKNLSSLRCFGRLK